jgi:glucokinase
MNRHSQDDRIVMTLDAGGTSFRFGAMRASEPLAHSVTLPSHGDNLDRCLASIIAGFNEVKSNCPAAPVAISFAFPGPADYPNGIIRSPFNLPAFRGGVALGPMLADVFRLPVFINNDGDLFTFGEAMAGLLPHVNGLLKKSGSPRRYRNLIGLTLGTGTGGGIVTDGRLLAGDNSAAGEVWLLRNKLSPETNVEEGASIRAVRRAYTERAGMAFDQSPDPREIGEIGLGTKPGSRAAAIEAFRRMGEIAGDALAAALTLVDGLVVIGGGLSGAAPLFLPAMVAELNGTYASPDGQRIPRLASRAFNLEDPGDMKIFLQGEPRELAVPGGNRTVKYDALQRVGVGLSRLGTSEAINLGAYAVALDRLDTQK